MAKNKDSALWVPNKLSPLLFLIFSVDGLNPDLSQEDPDVSLHKCSPNLFIEMPKKNTHSEKDKLFDHGARENWLSHVEKWS